MVLRLSEKSGAGERTPAPSSCSLLVELGREGAQLRIGGDLLHEFVGDVALGVGVRRDGADLGDELAISVNQPSTVEALAPRARIFICSSSRRSDAARTPDPWRGPRPRGRPACRSRAPACALGRVGLGPGPAAEIDRQELGHVVRPLLGEVAAHDQRARHDGVGVGSRAEVLRVGALLQRVGVGRQTPAKSPLPEVSAVMICAWPRLTNCMSLAASPILMRHLREA